MGMYDSFHVQDNPFGIPYSKSRKDPDYQTKDLECQLNVYAFTPEGRIVCTYSDGSKPTGETYTGDIFIYDHLEANSTGITWIEFKLEVVRGQVINVECLQGEPLHVLQKAYDTQRIKFRSRTDIEGFCATYIEPKALPNPVNVKLLR